MERRSPNFSLFVTWKSSCVMFFTVISSGCTAISSGSFIYFQARFLTFVESVAEKSIVCLSLGPTIWANIDCTSG